MPINGSSYIVHFCWYYTIHAVSRYLHSKFSIFVGKLLKVVDRLVYYNAESKAESEARGKAWQMKELAP